MLPQHWIEHRRADGERVGWIAPDGESFTPHDLLGRPLTAHPVEWLDAEELLEERGIGYLADRWLLRRTDGSEGPVRIAELDTERVVVLGDDYGAASAVGATPERYELPFPVDGRLRPA
jgi:hypothetical protein